MNKLVIDNDNEIVILNDSEKEMNFPIDRARVDYRDKCEGVPPYEIQVVLLPDEVQLI